MTTVRVSVMPWRVILLLCAAAFATLQVERVLADRRMPMVFSPVCNVEGALLVGDAAPPVVFPMLAIDEPHSRPCDVLEPAWPF